MNKNKYLLIDDDEEIGQLLKDYFSQYGIELLLATLPSQGLLLLEKGNPDCLILDVMLPEMDGFELLNKIRNFSQIPIIMLTARGDVTDRIVGIEMGADDYLPKPFEPRELMARCHALTRRNRSAEKESNLLAFRGLEINTQSQQVYVDQQPVKLTAMEYKALELMAKQPTKVFSRDDLLNELKGIDTKLFSRALDILISRLRHKLKNSHNRQFIQTEWGKGYYFVGEPL